MNQWAHSIGLRVKTNPLSTYNYLLQPALSYHTIFIFSISPVNYLHISQSHETSSSHFYLSSISKEHTFIFHYLYSTQIYYIHTIPTIILWIKDKVLTIFYGTYQDFARLHCIKRYNGAIRVNSIYLTNTTKKTC